MPDPSPAPLTPEEHSRLPKSLDPVLSGFVTFVNDRCCSIEEERECHAESLALERDILALVDGLAARREENERLRGKADVVRCAFCGCAYPPGTPTSQHERLTAHVLVCERHPMRAMDAVIAAARVLAPKEVRSALYKASEYADDAELRECAALARALDEFDAKFAAPAQEAREG